MPILYIHRIGHHHNFELKTTQIQYIRHLFYVFFCNNIFFSCTESKKINENLEVQL